MRALGVLGGIAVAAVVAAVIWLSVAQQFLDLWHAAWWACVAALAFPATMLSWYVYEEHWPEWRAELRLRRAAR